MELMMGVRVVKALAEVRVHLLVCVIHSRWFQTPSSGEGVGRCPARRNSAACPFFLGGGQTARHLRQSLQVILLVLVVVPSWPISIRLPFPSAWPSKVQGWGQRRRSGGAPVGGGAGVDGDGSGDGGDDDGDEHKTVV